MQRVVLTPSALGDLREAIEHYNIQQMGLGLRFGREVDELFRQMKDSPDSFDPIDDQFRRALVKRFPYVLYFRIESQQIVVLAILHGARHPSRCKNRLSDENA